MRSVAANFAALDAFPTSLWIDSISLDTVPTNADCADHVDALMSVSTPATPTLPPVAPSETSEVTTRSFDTSDFAGTSATIDPHMRPMSLSLSSSKSLDADLFFLTDAMMFNVLDDESEWGVDDSVSVSSDGTDMEITESVAGGLEVEGSDAWNNDNERTDKDESDGDGVTERRATRSAAPLSRSITSKRQRHSFELDQSWVMVEMGDVEVTVAQCSGTIGNSTPAATEAVGADSSTLNAAIAASLTVLSQRSSAEESQPRRRKSPRVTSIPQPRAKAPKRSVKVGAAHSRVKAATSTRKSTSTRTQLGPTLAGVSPPPRPSLLATLAAPADPASVPSETATAEETTTTTTTPTSCTTDTTQTTKMKLRPAKPSVAPPMSPSTTSAVQSTRQRGRAKTRTLDPIARVHQRKTKQRGYERNYRGRLRTQRCEFELRWLAHEAELRKVLASKHALVLLPREDAAADTRAQLVRKYTQLMYEERALKEEVMHLRVVDKWLEALSIWGVETEASRTIRYEVNTLPQLQAYPTFMDFVW